MAIETNIFAARYIATDYDWHWMWWWNVKTNDADLSVVLQVHAEDADMGENAKVLYSLVTSPNAPESFFEIDEYTGKLTTSKVRRHITISLFVEPICWTSSNVCFLLLYMHRLCPLSDWSVYLQFFPFIFGISNPACFVCLNPYTN